MTGQLQRRCCPLADGSSGMWRGGIWGPDVSWWESQDKDGNTLGPGETICWLISGARPQPRPFWISVRWREVQGTGELSELCLGGRGGLQNPRVSYGSGIWPKSFTHIHPPTDSSQQLYRGSRITSPTLQVRKLRLRG